MDNPFALNVLDEMISVENFTDEQYVQFCEDVRRLDSMFQTDDFYLEKVYDPKSLSKQSLGTTAKNTLDTTGQVLSAYDSTTTAGGKLIKAMFDLIMGAVKLIARVIGFIFNIIASVPLTITKVAKAVATIPTTVRSKIHGNVKLYISIQDIEYLYNEGLMLSLRKCISLAGTLASGDMWSTFFNRRAISSTVNNGKKTVHILTNDMKTCKKLQEEYLRLQLLRFDPEEIDMNKPENVNAYFSTDASVKFKDLSGEEHHSSYFEALLQLVADLKGFQDELGVVQTAIGQKLDHTVMREQFTSLRGSEQRLITGSIQNVSKIISSVGNILKSVITDVKTIQDGTDKIIKKGKITTDKAASKAVAPATAQQQTTGTS